MKQCNCGYQCYCAVNNASATNPFLALIPSSQTIHIEEQPTLRDQFAMAALAAIARGPASNKDEYDFLYDAQTAYRYADEMLRARQNEGGGEG